MKLLNTSDEKLVNAVLYFCENTRYLSQTKLYKLLYFLDFFHFRETGRPVTGLDYFAWDKGPVPTKLYFEIQNKEAPRAILECINERKDEYTQKRTGLFFRSSRPPEMDVFSPREQEILEKVAFIFREARADDIIEATHLKNAPWQKTLSTKGLKKKIDYELALDKDAKINLESAQERMELSTEMRRLFGPKKKNG